MKDQKPTTGVWDQWCVMSSRPYIQLTRNDNGEEVEQTSLLDLDTCRKIVLNFGLRKDDLPSTLGHQKTTADKAQYKTATYSAMAVWHKGQIVEFAAHGDVARPAETDLPRADNGQRPEDGIYVFRKTITDLGSAIVAQRAVGKTSPEFVMDGLNQQAESVGPMALGLAWTDDPFLDGCEINLERFPQMRKYARTEALKMASVNLPGHGAVPLPAGISVDWSPAHQGWIVRWGSESVLKVSSNAGEIADYLKDLNQGRTMNYEKEAGVEEKDSPEQKYEKIKSHFGRKSLMEAGISDSDTTDVAMAKFAKHMECHESADKDKEKTAMEGPKAIPGAPTYVDTGEPRNEPVGGVAMERETVSAMSAQIKQQRAQMEAMQRQLASYETERKAEHARRLVSAAWNEGRIVPKTGESDEQAQARFLRKYERDPKIFEDDLAPSGTHAVGTLLSGRMTRAGLPLAFERSSQVIDEPSRADEAIIHRAEALRKEDPRLSRYEAVGKVCMESPNLGEAYITQPRRAALGLA